MPKAGKGRRGHAAQHDPYGGAGGTGIGHAIFKMKTDIGQHVLKNPGVAQAIVDKAQLKQSDIVLEVGPGTGNLTVKILEKAKKVIAVELDPRMAAEVTKRVQGTPAANRLDVLLGDVCKMELPYFDVCISNTPYQISSPLTARLLAHSPPPRICVLTYQMEFAQRLTATSSSPLYSRLSLNTQMFAHVTHIMKVSRNNFKPPPAVESSVVRLVPKNPRPDISFEEWDGLLRIAFVRKNRTLRASFLGTSTVVDLLVTNYRTWCAQNGVALIDEGIEMELDDSGNTKGQAASTPARLNSGTDTMQKLDDDEWTGIADVDEDMDLDAEASNLFPKLAATEDLQLEKTVPKRKRTKLESVVREKLRRVLEDVTLLADRRARQCNETDFLKLLWSMNEEGIHFS